MREISILAPKNNNHKKVLKQMADHIPAGRADWKKDICWNG